MYRISPDLAKELQVGQFLTAPDDAKVKDSGDPDYPDKRWRETFIIRNAEVKTDGQEGQPGYVEMVQLTLTVPSDVVSANQGRTAPTTLRFPWADAEAGEKGAQTSCSINFRELMALLNAVGFEGEIGTLSDLPLADLRNMRVNAQVKLAPDRDGVLRQNIGYFRAPK